MIYKPSRTKIKKGQDFLGGSPYQDTYKGRGSLLEKYWNAEGFIEYFNSFRTPGIESLWNIPGGKEALEQTPAELLTKEYKFNGVEYGRWLNENDRFNYTMFGIIAAYDLDKIMATNGNLGGWGVISVSYGARGHGKALAHFTAHNFNINITRYRRLDKEIKRLERHALSDKSIEKLKRLKYGGKQGTDAEKKTTLLETTGGAGSFAHEYGHALDYLFGTYISKHREYRSLTPGWAGINLKETQDKIKAKQADKYREAMYNVLRCYIWNDGKEKNGYTKDYKHLKDMQLDAYWYRAVEIWARTFEAFIGYELERKNIFNTFLTQKKYEPGYYPNLERNRPLYKAIDKLLDVLSAELKKRNVILKK